MNWSCEQVIYWLKSFIDDRTVLARFEGQNISFNLLNACFLSKPVFTFVLSINSSCMYDSVITRDLFVSINEIVFLHRENMCACAQEKLFCFYSLSSNFFF